MTAKRYSLSSRSKEQTPVENSTSPIISVKNLWKLYGAEADTRFRSRGTAPTEDEVRDLGLFPAVRDVNLDVNSGEILVIMGLSGSGKSTLLRCISKLIETSFGQTTVEGINLETATPAELLNLRRYKMGMVFQHYALLAHRTVLENVSLPLEIRGEPKAEREKRAREMIDLVGLNGRENAFSSGLSGGQQQRVGIARSLAVDPDIWFLDEPFSALDPLIRRELQDEFIRLQQIVRKTILFVTHDFDEAIRLANRIAIMEGGRIVQIGTPEELVLNPADDYVANFTKHVNKSHVVSLRAIMSEQPENAIRSEVTVLADAKLGEVAQLIMDASGPTTVVDHDGKAVGVISKDSVLELLLEGMNTD
jgi:glycine betaine/proline transport system ATP-binding protein